MTFEELLTACSTGKLPRVVVNKPVQHSETRKGVVTVIKNNVGSYESGYKGCAVRFDDMAYDTWFHAEPGKDERRHYMSELKIDKKQK